MAGRARMFVRMNKIGVYFTSDKGPTVRVILTARDGTVKGPPYFPKPRGLALDEAFEIEGAFFDRGTWMPLALVDSNDMVNLLALALCLRQPATVVPIGEMPDMPVWVVREGVAPSALVAKLYQLALETSSDTRMPTVRA